MCARHSAATYTDRCVPMSTNIVPRMEFMRWFIVFKLKLTFITANGEFALINLMSLSITTETLKYFHCFRWY